MSSNEHKQKSKIKTMKIIFNKSEISMIQIALEYLLEAQKELLKNANRTGLDEPARIEIIRNIETLTEITKKF